VGDFFGRNNFATIRGWMGMLQSFAAMPAAVFTGWIYDQTQSYTYALVPFIVIYVLAGVVLWQAPRPKRPTAETLSQVTSRIDASLAGG